MEIKTAIITGASQGIGAAIAKGLAGEGYRTILVSRNQDNLELVKADIVTTFSEAPEPIVLCLDITNSAEVKEAVKKIYDLYENISVLVNNAGIHYAGTLEGSEDRLNKMLSVNLVAPFILMKEVIQYMKLNNRGYIFNVSSRAGKYGFAESGIYSASKFGLAGLSESFFRELDDTGIKITTICPGWVNTSMAFDSNTPLSENEMIQPEDIFKTIKYLLNLSETVTIKEIVVECKKSIA